MDVHLVEVGPLTVASTLAYGPEPEPQALQRLLAWAKPRHLLDAPHMLYGFNNPSPSAGSPNYGYEMWLTVGPDVQGEAPITIKAFAGGLYAVARVTGVANIPAAWMELAAWAESSPYQRADHQWLEAHIVAGEDIPPEAMVLDLYLPVRG